MPTTKPSKTKARPTLKATKRKTKPTSKRATSYPSRMFLDVLGYKEDEDWVVLALQMDLRGYGATIDEAMKELAELVVMQIRFARFKGQPEMILKPAEPFYWKLFEATVQEHLRSITLNYVPRDPDYEVRALPLPPAHVIAKLSSFREANA